MCRIPPRVIVNFCLMAATVVIVQACASGYSQFYEQIIPQTFSPTSDVKVYALNDDNVNALKKQGYFIVGRAGFTGVYTDENTAVEQARKVGADVVLISVLHDKTVRVPDQNLPVYNAATGQTTNIYQPGYNIERYNHQALFLRRTRAESKAPASIASRQQATSSGAEDSNKYTEQGMKLLNEGKYKEAVEQFEKADKSEPRWKVHFGMGRAYYGLGDFKTALRYFSRASNFNPNMMKIHNWIAWSHVELSEYDAAIKEFEAANDIAQDWSNFYGLGIARYRTDSFFIATSNFKRALELNSENPAVSRWLGWSQYRLKEYEKAVGSFNKVLEKESNPDALEGCGLALYELGRYDEAADLLNRALNLSKEEKKKQQLRNKISYVYLAQRKYAKVHQLLGQKPLIGVELKKSSDGIRITKVATGGPAELAGLRAGDVMTSFNGESMVGVEPEVFVAKHFSQLPFQAEVEVDYLRNNQALQTVLVLGVSPDLSAKARLALAGKKGDTTAPVITILEPKLRGIAMVVKKKRVRVAGKAIDESGVYEVLVNGKDARLASDGVFEADVLLTVGDNTIDILATDTRGNTGTRRLNLTRSAGAETVRAEQPEPDWRNTGQYHALLIGNNQYRHLPKLITAVNDAHNVAGLLEREYGFQTRVLVDATRDQIVRAINEYRKILAEADNFLLYYAGHGDFDHTANKAYWLPVDASAEEDTEWIIVDTITSNLKRMTAGHILVVADSCYSGTLTRRIVSLLDRPSERREFIEKMFDRSSRTLLASGGNEPVADSGGQGNSVFAAALLHGLRNMEMDVFTTGELFSEYIKERVAGNSDQVPEYNPIRNSGHSGGDFVFMRQRN